MGIYGKEEVDKFKKQILFYRELGVSLDSIKNIITSPSFDGVVKHLKSIGEKNF